MLKKIVFTLFCIIVCTFVGLRRGLDRYKCAISDDSCTGTDFCRKGEENATDWERQIGYAEGIYRSVTIQVVVFGLSAVGYWYTVLMYNKIIPETRTWADNIATGYFGQEETKKLALKDHNRHVGVLRRYFYVEILVSVFIYTNFFETMRIKDQGIKILEYVERVSNSTMASHQDTDCLRDQLEVLMLFSCSLYALYVVVAIVSDINHFFMAASVLKYYVYLYNGAHPAIKAPEIEHNRMDVAVVEEIVIPKCWEYLMLQHVAKTGEPRLTQHVERNIVASRRPDNHRDD